MRYLTGGLLVIATLSGCRPKDDQPVTPATTPNLHAGIELSSAAADAPPMSANARIPLDSGNKLYRAKRYPEALAQYRLAAARSPGDPTAYYGVFMVAAATKNTKLADSAMQMMRGGGGTTAR